QFVEERQVQVHHLILGAVERPDGLLGVAARRVDAPGEQPQFRLLVSAAQPPGGTGVSHRPGGPYAQPREALFSLLAPREVVLLWLVAGAVAPLAQQRDRVA